MAAAGPRDDSEGSHERTEALSREPVAESADDVTRWLAQVAPDIVADHAQFRRLLLLLDRYQGERWGRHVSAGDTIVDRWERAKRLGFGEGSSVYDSALVLGDVSVGRDTWIGPGTVLDGSGGLTIGDMCSISVGAQIYSHDTVLWAVSGGRAEAERMATSVGSNTYIGPNAIISKGVAVGSRCVIGASSLVLDDVPDSHVAYGTPARVIETTEEFLTRRGSSL
jgi:acetyltransferase-like isoleucine patch superfamily enzyme